MRNLVSFIFVLVFVTLIAKPFVTIGGYSEGERSGELVKFSNKGLLCKTWEGVLQTGETSGTQFGFTVEDETVIDSLSQWVGQEVKLVYDQNLTTGACRGDSDYFIIKAYK